MGIQDRDYYRERYRRTARPLRAEVRHFPKQSTTKLGVILFWLVIGFVVFVAAERWAVPLVEMAKPMLHSGPRDASRSSAPMPSPPREPIAPTTGVRIPREAQTWSPPPATAIIRCGNSYGTEPCTNGHAVESPAATGFDSTPSPRLAAMVQQGRTSGDSTNITSYSTTTTVNGVTTTSQSSTGSKCVSLASRLSGIDADARRPHPLPYQDWLRAQRQQVRDSQAALHC